LKGKKLKQEEEERRRNEEEEARKAEEERRQAEEDDMLQAELARRARKAEARARAEAERKRRLEDADRGFEGLRFGDDGKIIRGRTLFLGNAKYGNGRWEKDAYIVDWGPVHSWIAQRHGSYVWTCVIRKQARTVTADEIAEAKPTCRERIHFDQDERASLREKNGMQEPRILSEQEMKEMDDRIAARLEKALGSNRDETSDPQTTESTMHGNEVPVDFAEGFGGSYGLPTPALRPSIPNSSAPMLLRTSMTNMSL